MSYIRLFFKESLSLNFNSTLDKPQSYYLSKVMRMNEGQSFSLFNHGGEWEAKIQSINKGIIDFLIVKKLRSANTEKEIWLAFAPIKFNYLNLMIQKGTEIGVTKFIPILTERTIVRKINEKRINKIIVEASEQSNRIKVPSLDKLIKFDNFLDLNQKVNIIFGDLNTKNKKIEIKNKDPICILFGPEGDFSVNERKKILELKNILPVKINNNILRSETAAISLISIINFNLLS